MSLNKIILKFFLNSRVLFLFPPKPSSAPHVTASVPERNNHFISNPKTAQRERGRMKEGKKKESEETLGKLLLSFPFSTPTVHQNSPSMNFYLRFVFHLVIFAAITFHCNTIKYVFFGGKKN